MAEIINTVDSTGNRGGEMEKLAAHQQGVLHEAFSIFIFNKLGELLLQQRAIGKYHSGGLWTNTCCSHARVGENISTAVHRRLQEEMGFDTELEEVFTFTYKVAFDNGLTEHEFDHVFIGNYEGEIKPDADEVESYKWVNIAKLKGYIEHHPEKYTYWLKIILGSDQFNKITL